MKNFIYHLLRVLACLAAFAALMHALNFFEWLPKPITRGNVDDLVLSQQQITAQERTEAEWLFVGDSSCLMDIAPVEMERVSGKKIVNLGTLSYMPLSFFGDLVSRYHHQNSNTVKAVILIVHPELLTGRGEAQANTDSSPDPSQRPERERFYSQLKFITGLETFEKTIFTRIIPQVLPGAYGRYYGFDRVLLNYIRKQKTLVDPRSYLKGNSIPHYALNHAIKEEAASFRQSIPKNIPLLVGIAPLPTEIAPPNYAAQQKQMLEEFSAALQADHTLNLPATYPLILFASATHLNKPGQKSFSKALAKAMLQWEDGNVGR